MYLEIDIEKIHSYSNLLHLLNCCIKFTIPVCRDIIQSYVVKITNNHLQPQWASNSSWRATAVRILGRRYTRQICEICIK